MCKYENAQMCKTYPYILLQKLNGTTYKIA